MATAAPALRVTKLFEDAQPFAAHQSADAALKSAPPPAENDAAPTAPAAPVAAVIAPRVEIVAPAPAPAETPAAAAPAAEASALTDASQAQAVSELRAAPVLLAPAPALAPAPILIPSSAVDASVGAPSVSADAVQSAEAAPAPAEAEAERIAPVADPEPAPLDPERRALAGDAAFHADRFKGLIVLGAGLWLSLAAGALVALALSPLTAAGLGVAAAVALATYAVTAVITGLLLDRALERKLNEIRKIARIGCERVRVDDIDLVRPALRDVLSEWLHIQFFIRRHRETNLWFMWGFGAQSLLTAGALLALPWAAMIGDPIMRTGLIGVALGLTALHAVWEIRRLREQRRTLILETGQDPTAVIAGRMIGLLEEVKELRKHGRLGR